MTCREFNQQIEALSLAELASSADEELLAHGHQCGSCANWLQQRQAMAAAMQALRHRTAALEAPVEVQHAVMRAFRQGTVPNAPSIELRSQPFAFRLSRIFGWGALASAAAALAISVGLGIWFWQHSGKPASESASQSAAVARQPAVPSQAPLSAKMEQQASPETLRVSKLSRTPNGSGRVSKAVVPTRPIQSASPDSALAQAGAQAYVPLMLCDPLSCSGDEQLLRMELPAGAADGVRDSSQPLMADVVLGDDGLVRAIRIVQQ